MGGVGRGEVWGTLPLTGGPEAVGTVAQRRWEYLLEGMEN